MARIKRRIKRGKKLVFSVDNRQKCSCQFACRPVPFRVIFVCVFAAFRDVSTPWHIRTNVSDIWVHKVDTAISALRCETFLNRNAKSKRTGPALFIAWLTWPGYQNLSLHAGADFAGYPDPQCTKRCQEIESVPEQIPQVPSSWPFLFLKQSLGGKSGGSEFLHTQAVHPSHQKYRILPFGILFFNRKGNHVLVSPSPRQCGRRFEHGVRAPSVRICEQRCLVWPGCLALFLFLGFNCKRCSSWR